MIQRFSVLENLTEKMKYWRREWKTRQTSFSYISQPPLTVFFVWMSYYFLPEFPSSEWHTACIRYKECESKCRISVLKLCICVQVLGFFNVQISCLDFLSLTVTCSCHWTLTIAWISVLIHSLSKEVEISNTTVLRRPALDCRYIPKVLSLRAGGNCSRSHLNYFEQERGYEFSKMLHVMHIYFTYCSKLCCTVGGIMKSVMENALKLMGASLLVWDQTFNKNFLFHHAGNTDLTLQNPSYGGTVVLGSSPQGNGPHVLLYHKPRFYKISLLREYVMALVPERNKTYVITDALCVNGIRLPLPSWH